MTIRAENEMTLVRVDNGEEGADGTTFYPSVSSEGVISWTNDGGKENPESRIIKGDDGQDGKSAYEAAVEAGYAGTEEDFNADLARTARIEQIESDLSGIEGRVEAAEGNISTVETAIGNPSDSASASGSLYARVKNAKNVGDQAIADIQAEVTRAQAAEQSAETAAANAQSSATAANTAANNALSELGVVESVTDTLNWFVDHKKLTDDTTVVSNKNYYIYNPTTGTLTKATPVGTENPHALGWFELSEAISEYVASHVALTNDGLYVVNVSGGWKVLISNGAGSFTAGIFILSPSGEIMQASTANGISFSENKPFYIGDDDAAIVFDGNGHISIAGTGITMGSKTLSSVLDELGSSLKSIEYGKGSSPTSHSDIANWSTTTPVWEEGKYIWMRTTTNGLTYTYTCIQGAQGESGDSAISISINSENGLIFKNTISTSLTAVVNVGLTKISNMNDLREYFGDDATIIWYKNDIYYDTGFTLMNVTGNTKMDFRCELMV